MNDQKYNVVYCDEYGIWHVETISGEHKRFTNRNDALDYAILFPGNICIVTQEVNND